jgi:hypothetical protein
MSPCSPNDVSFSIPDGPSGPAIPGFGTPFSLKLPNLNPFPDGFPEDLLDLLDKLQMLIPPGALKASLNPNFGKDVFDAIMKLLDQFMPYLMMYKFFLPILKIILCVIEVLCSISNPIKVVRALKRLFRNCLPDFLNLFPIFALILMIISLLLLLLALIEYIINQILSLIRKILRNLKALYGVATATANDTSIMAIAKKLGALLCVFQNLFVLLAIFNIIIDVFRDILSLVFSIPPCDDTPTDNEDGCCTPDVCPNIIKQNLVKVTGQLQYYNQLSMQTTLPLPFGSSPFFTVDVRPESWQIYDTQQTRQEAFINIVDAYDVTNVTPKPIFFPTDVTYSALTAPKQAAYTVDMRMYYNPINWGRTGITAGQPRWIRFNNCIVLQAPTVNLSNYDGSYITVDNGVLKLAGGTGVEDDNTTPLTGYETDGITPSASIPATLESFLHKKQVVSPAPTPFPTDGYHIVDVEYTFKPSHAVLLGKNIVTAGCLPDFAIDRTFVGNVYAGDAALKLASLNDIMKKENGFPDPNATQECLTAAVSRLRSHLTAIGVAEFQATCTTCLQKLKDDTNKALGAMVGLGFDACKSSFNVEPSMQFTTKPIKISVNINERNGYPITSSLTPEIAEDISRRIKAHSTFGEVTNFMYDGYQVFTAELTSKTPGKGQMMISFDDNIFCTNTLPSDMDQEPTHTLQALDYQFIFAKTGIGTSTSEGDGTGQPRRDEGDMSRGAGSNKGGS